MRVLPRQNQTLRCAVLLAFRPSTTAAASGLLDVPPTRQKTVGDQGRKQHCRKWVCEVESKIIAFTWQCASGPRVVGNFMLSENTFVLFVITAAYQAVTKCRITVPR
jgi:hypothetical protein